MANKNETRSNNINNCVTRWSLGAWDVLELPLLAASSTTETAPIADKTWQPSPWKDRQLSQWYRMQWKAEGEDGREQKPLNTDPHAKLLLHATLTNKLYHPKQVEFHSCATIPRPMIMMGWGHSQLIKLCLTSFKPRIWNHNVDIKNTIPLAGVAVTVLHFLFLLLADLWWLLFLLHVFSSHPQLWPESEISKKALTKGLPVYAFVLT